MKVAHVEALPAPYPSGHAIVHTIAWTHRRLHGQSGCQKSPHVLVPDCVSRRVKLHWPKAQADAARLRAGNAALLQAWLRDVDPAVACTLNTRLAVQAGLYPSMTAAPARAGSAALPRRRIHDQPLHRVHQAVFSCDQHKLNQI